MSRHDHILSLIVTVASVLGIVIFVAQLLGALFDGDPTGFMRVSTQNATVIHDTVGLQVLGGQDGHDGYFFFQLANDPLIRESEILPTFDDPVHRASRVLYPLIAGAAGTLPTQLLPWSLIVVNVIAVAIGALSSSRLFARLGATPLLGFLFVVNFGILFSISIDGASVLAMALLVLGLERMCGGKDTQAIVAFAASILTREFNAVFVVAALAFRHRSQLSSFVRSAIAAVLPYLTVRTFYTIWFENAQQQETLTRNFGPPLKGMLDSVPAWLDAQFLYQVGIVTTLGSLVVLTATALRKRTLLAATGAIAAPIAIFMTAEILAQAFDMTRVLAPVTLLAAAALLETRDRSSHSEVDSTIR